MNFSKSGASLSIGHRGAWYTVGPRGRRVSVGLQGTGLFLTTTIGIGNGDSGKRLDLVGTEISSAGQSNAQPTAFHPDDRGKRAEFSLHIGC